MFLILVANNATGGTLQDYQPATFRYWARGSWARNSWGMNDEFITASPPAPTGAPTGRRRKIGTLVKRGGVGRIARSK